jgi:hypothetical protein
MVMFFVFEAYEISANFKIINVGFVFLYTNTFPCYYYYSSPFRLCALTASVSPVSYSVSCDDIAA